MKKKLDNDMIKRQKTGLYEKPLDYNARKDVVKCHICPLKYNK